MKVVSCYIRIRYKRSQSASFIRVNTACLFVQAVENGGDDVYCSSDEEQGKKVAQKKYEQFQQMCGDLLDPSNYFNYYWHLLLVS